MGHKWDFSGWATRNDLECSDGRTIRSDAFKHCDGKKVPLVWGHDHHNVSSVLGHGVLENRREGVYVYGKFNNTPAGKDAKECVMHGDVAALSIFANHLRQTPRGDVMHGDIKEVSLVVSGANPGAFIEEVMAHDGDSDNSGMYIGYDERIIIHSDEDDDDDENGQDDDTTIGDILDTLDDEQADALAYVIEAALSHADPDTLQHSDDDPDLESAFESMTEEQQNAAFATIAMAQDIADEDYDDEDDDWEDDIEHSDMYEGGNSTMGHNIFENGNSRQTLSHADRRALCAAVIEEAKRGTSLKEAFIGCATNMGYLQHADSYGVEDIEFLFPEAKTITGSTPEFIKREDEWVRIVMAGVHKSPFTRIKSVFADITEDDARAKGYLKGNRKTEEVFSLLKRSTSPTTVYKKQKLDRDDVIDITDFDVISWIKAEMRVMLEEETARAILFGDGRLASSNDKIDELCIRPIWKDDSLYTINTIVRKQEGEDYAKSFITAAIKSRKKYKGSGNPIMFMTEDLLTDCLLLEDGIGHPLYEDEAKLARKLRVSKIVTVPVMEGLVVERNGKEYDLLGLMVNLNDYTVGADKGGQVTMFDDFDINFNQMLYLIETRMSGALTKPFSAMSIEMERTNAQG